MTPQINGHWRRFVSVFRAHEWWSYKLAPVLGSAYAAALFADQPLISLWPLLVFILVALAIGAAYASVINNVCDREEDRIAGKPNYFIGRSRSFMALVLAACIVPGLAAAAALRSVPAALALYIGNWLLFAAYSAAPLRLKRRGFWGILAMAVGESFVPQWFAVLLVAGETGAAIPSAWFLAVAVWSLALGMRSILWHQLLDLDNDHQAGVETFAVGTSAGHLQKLGLWVAFPLEAVGLLGILAGSANPIAWVLFAVYLVTEYLRNRYWATGISIVGTGNGRSGRLFLFEYYDVFYPLGFLCLAAWANPINLVVLGIHLLFYHQRLGWWARDVWGLVRWEIPAELRKF